MATPAGLEPATPCLEGRCSIQLSYELDNVSNWDADYIKKRSERLVSLAWDKMILWLS